MFKKIFGLSSHYLSDRENRISDSIYDELIQLRKKVKELENNYIELTNALYESENRIQSQIDKYHPSVYDLKDFTLGDS
jgi:hypothetical protein